MGLTESNMAEVASATLNWLTRDECVATLQCSLSAFRRMVLKGHITDRKVGGRRRYWREDVERIAAPPNNAA
jgi:hypothetical protein